MNSISNVILLPSLKMLLGRRLQNIFASCYPEVTEIARKRIDLALANDTASSSINPVIPLNQVKNVPHIWYVSAIALKISSHLPSPVLSVADAIAQELMQPMMTRYLLSGEVFPVERSQHLFTVIAQTAKVWTTDPGWVHWQLTTPGIIAWIRWMITILMANHGHYLAQFPPPIDPVLESRNGCNDSHWIDDSALFDVQYAHARCSALLRLAIQEQRLTWPWIDLQASPSEAPITPSIDSRFEGAERAWRSPLPAEWSLLSTVVATVDRLRECLSPAIAMPIAQELSRRLREFDAACPLLAGADPAIVQARLELVLMTRSLLHVLLQDSLHRPAPSSL